MTPKEKAQELVDKNYQIFEDDEDVHFIYTSERISKEFALIAVDEILNTGTLGSLLEEYYQKVKQEIINL